MLTDAEREKRLAELHAEDRRRAEEFRAAFARNAEVNALAEARRNPENDLRFDEERENGVAEDKHLRRRGYVDGDGI